MSDVSFVRLWGLNRWNWLVNFVDFFSEYDCGGESFKKTVIDDTWIIEIKQWWNSKNTFFWKNWNLVQYGPNCRTLAGQQLCSNPNFSMTGCGGLWHGHISHPPENTEKFSHLAHFSNKHFLSGQWVRHLLNESIPPSTPPTQDWLLTYCPPCPTPQGWSRTTLNNSTIHPSLPWPV